MFSLAHLAIQKSISPITSLLTPRLPVSVILTSSPASAIYEQILLVCDENKWGVSTDRPNGKVR